QVESTLFRVPRGVLAEHSEVFQGMFSLPSGGIFAEGMSDENPIFLRDIVSQDFKSLLKVLLSRLVNESGDNLPSSIEEWTSVLKLSHLWGMEDISSLAVEKMSAFAIDPVDKAALAVQYDVKAWLTPALNNIARREKPLTKEDVDKLGLDFVLKIAEVRESLTRVSTGTNSHSDDNGDPCVQSDIGVGKRYVGDLDFTTRIDEVFHDYLS
ncbi:hypothetical protein CONPUDRAFT_56949, partial [Coniophora puteana RWD-64-598 SS2]